MGVAESDAKKFNDTPFILSNTIGSDKVAKNAIEAFDKIDLINFAQTIAKFIKDCETPMTIGLQGDWGSGKTTLMNMIKYYLPDDNINKIDINTWHYSIFHQDEYLGIVVIKSLVDELVKTFEKNKSDLSNAMKEKCSSVLKKAIKVGKAIQFGIPYVGGISIKDAEEALSDNPIQIENLSAIMLEFKQQFTNIIKENIVQKGEKIFIFVDDLDRIRPVKAIEVLETLKNFMDVEGCVFVLAVDYEVVQLGIEAKFGKDLQKTSGKSFFDKIIQLPFTMPTSSYNIEKYLIDLLVASKFFHGDENRKINTDFFVDITEVTLGRNPRSIKRAVNYASLLEIIFAKNATREVQRTIKNMQLLYAMVCMQIAWPELFEYFVLKPTPETIKELENWDSLEKLPHAKRLFSRISEVNREEVRDNISAFFDNLYEILDTEEKDGIITDKELEPLLKVLEVVKLTSARIIQKNANVLRNFFRNILCENQGKDSSCLNFFDQIYLKSYLGTNDKIEHKKAGKRYITIVWNKKQIGSLVTLKTRPLLIRIKTNRSNILSHFKNDSESETYSKIIKDIENPDTLTGIGDTEIDWKVLLDLNDKNKSKEILNEIFNAIISESNAQAPAATLIKQDNDA